MMIFFALFPLLQANNKNLFTHFLCLYKRKSWKVIKCANIHIFVNTFPPTSILPASKKKIVVQIFYFFIMLICIKRKEICLQRGICLAAKYWKKTFSYLDCSTVAAFFLLSTNPLSHTLRHNSSSSKRELWVT